MHTYYCLRFKSQAQWEEVSEKLALGEVPGAALDVIGALPYDESFKGTPSPYFHVNAAWPGEALPEALETFVVKPEFIKRTFNGAGMHEVLDKADYARVPNERIKGADLSKEQLAALSAVPLAVKLPTLK